jgi:putative transcriptional regulator
MIKNRLEDIRIKKLGYKFQKDFAEWLGMEVSMYCLYENNKKKKPDPDMMFAIVEKVRERIPDIKFEDVFYRVVEK